jgi:hypothetical protein
MWQGTGVSLYDTPLNPLSEGTLKYHKATPPLFSEGAGGVYFYYASLMNYAFN